MNNSELIKELRTLTGAGMKDCKDAIDASEGDLVKAVDLIKTKGLNIVSGREGKIAAEGRVDATCMFGKKCTIMVEVNCQTDFTANSPEFKSFVDSTKSAIIDAHQLGLPFDAKVAQLESERQNLVSKTKENVVVRRWWIEEVFDDTCRTFSYIHSNNKIGVIISMKGPSKEVADSKEFSELALDLAMQAAAMNPVAVSIERLSLEDINRQRAIFEAQLKELNKPQQAWDKIIVGKFVKWYMEVCLLEQESIIIPKTSVKQIIKNMSAKLGGEIEVINFLRCQVGEGIETKQENFAEEVAKMIKE